MGGSSFFSFQIWIQALISTDQDLQSTIDDKVAITALANCDRHGLDG